jgi:hypothetical protein
LASVTATDTLPAGKFTAEFEEDPLAHKYEYGREPPDAVTETVPFDEPKQLTPNPL